MLQLMIRVMVRCVKMRIEVWEGKGLQDMTMGYYYCAEERLRYRRFYARFFFKYIFIDIL